MGAALAVTGLGVVALSLLVFLGGLPPPAVAVAAVAAVALVLLTGVCLRARAVVRLDESGYRVRWVRGAGVKQGVWKDVEDVAATTVAGERCVVLRRRDGSTTTIPVGILAGSADAFVRDLQQHLNRGHGYRPVR